MISVLLGVEKLKLPKFYSVAVFRSFIQTANDLQIMDAISGCYEEYKVLKEIIAKKTLSCKI
jgi:hypothetical protein